MYGYYFGLNFGGLGCLVCVLCCVSLVWFGYCWLFGRLWLVWVWVSLLRCLRCGRGYVGIWVPCVWCVAVVAHVWLICWLLCVIGFWLLLWLLFCYCIGDVYSCCFDLIGLKRFGFDLLLSFWSVLWFVCFIVLVWDCFGLVCIGVVAWGALVLAILIVFRCLYMFNCSYIVLFFVLLLWMLMICLLGVFWACW